MPVKPSEGKMLYHMTHIDNVPSILKLGLKPRSALSQGDFEDIANQEIIQKRSERSIGLENYVPFHFYPWNPFDGDVCSKYGAENMVIITIWRTLAEKEGKIIPRHPLGSSDLEFYDYAKGFSEIHWDYLDDFGNRNYHDDDIKRACMAECLIGRIIQPSEFAFVLVPTAAAKSYIDGLPGASSIKVDVSPKAFPHLSSD